MSALLGGIPVINAFNPNAASGVAPATAGGVGGGGGPQRSYADLFNFLSGYKGGMVGGVAAAAAAAGTSGNDVGGAEASGGETALGAANGSLQQQAPSLLPGMMHPTQAGRANSGVAAIMDEGADREPVAARQASLEGVVPQHNPNSLPAAAHKDDLSQVSD